MNCPYHIMPELIVSKEGKVLFKVPLTQSGLVIGRGGACDVTLTDYDISRVHAEIFWKDSAFHVADKSSAGTFLNSKKISEASLEEGSIIGIGSWALRFQENAKADHQHDELKTCITRIQGESQTKILQLKKEKFIVISPILQVQTEGAKPRKYSLKEKNTVGSGEGCDLVLKDDYVSGKHCQIVRRGEEFVLIDLKSTNGTFISGQRVSETPLAKNTVITLGKTTLKLLEEEGEEKIRPLPEDQFCGMVGRSEEMRSLFAKISRVAPTTHTVLIQGETGSGKELVARSLHELSKRSQRPYVILNCGAISANLIESELFGHEKGAFTGALARRLGSFEQASGGTLFLDEIGELPLELQPKLLRVLENHRLRRVGGDAEIPVDVRVIAATHRKLAEEVKKGKFREDLYFRLYVIPLIVPTLEERKGDLPLLAVHFLKNASPEEKSFSPKALEKLGAHSWPGNVRELRNVILRSLIYSEESVIGVDAIEIMEGAKEDTGEVNLSQMEREKIEEALNKTGNNKTKAADLLGIAKSTLFKKLKEYDIPF